MAGRMKNKTKKKIRKVDWFSEAVRDPLRYALLSKIRRNTPLNSRHVVIRNLNKPLFSSGYTETPPPRYSLAVRNVNNRYTKGVKKLKKKKFKSKTPAYDFSANQTPSTSFNFSAIKTPPSSQRKGATGYTNFNIPSGNTLEKKSRFGSVPVESSASPVLPRRSSRPTKQTKLFPAK